MNHLIQLERQKSMANKLIRTIFAFVCLTFVAFGLGSLEEQGPVNGLVVIQVYEKKPTFYKHINQNGIYLFTLEF